MVWWAVVLPRRQICSLYVNFLALTRDAQSETRTRNHLQSQSRSRSRNRNNSENDTVNAMAGVNPLIPLMDGNHLEGLRAALSADPSLANRPLNGNTTQKPLDFCLRAGRLAEAQAVASVGGTGSEPALRAAAFGCNAATIEWVYVSGLDTALTEAVAEAVMARTKVPDANRVPSVDFLLDKGLRPSESMLLLAARDCQAVARVLVSRGLASPFPGSVERLLDMQNVAHPFTYALLPDRSNAAWVAIFAGSLPDLQAALTATPTAVLTSLTTRVGTPLHFAAARAFLPAFAILLAAGADPNFIARSGESLVGAAARSGSAAAVNAVVPLVAPTAVNAASVSPVQGRVMTPLVATVVAMGPVSVVRALLAAGADPNDTRCVGVPPGGWALYALQDPIASAAKGYTAATAKAIIHTLVLGNSTGQQANVDAVVPTWNGFTIRSFASSMGIAL